LTVRYARKIPATNALFRVRFLEALVVRRPAKFAGRYVEGCRALAVLAGFQFSKGN
jgi:hypothetical protein